MSVTAQPQKYQQAYTLNHTHAHVHTSQQIISQLPPYIGDRGWVLYDDLLMGVCLSQVATHLVSSGPISSLTSLSDTPTLPLAQSKSW